MEDDWTMDEHNALETAPLEEEQDVHAGEDTTPRPTPGVTPQPDADDTELRQRSQPESQQQSTGISPALSEKDFLSPFEVEPLILPDTKEVFAELRQQADDLFKFKPEDAERLLDVDAHALEVGTMAMTKDVSVMEEEKDAEDSELRAQWDGEVTDKIEGAREAVTQHQGSMRLKHSELQWRLREEEVAARERLVFEHQAMEASLLKDLRGRSGSLQHVPHDPTSWTIEWTKSPQEFACNVSCLRGLRHKVREGYYVLLMSLIDRVGGRTLRFSTGEFNKDCDAALPPLRYVAKSSNVDFFIDRQVQMMCPANILLQTHAALQFELWQLKVGKYDPTDKVVGWGVWPLVNKNFTVVEGKFKVPMLKGPVDQGIDTYRELTSAIKDNLSRWLCNCYFEISLRRKEHDQTSRDTMAMSLNENTADARQLRLNRTADDFRSLTVSKLPPRLFFDEVALGQSKTSGLRRRHFGSADMRALNNALWEKRALLEEEREALRTEVMRKKTKEDESDLKLNDWRIRKDIAKSKHTFRSAPSIVDAEEGQQDKQRDSHILLNQHHQSVVSQREFFFLGRRYRDKAEITIAVVAYDLGINPGGPWDKTKVVMNVFFALIGFLFRLYIHSMGLYLYLFSLDVPLAKNEWTVYSVDIQFEHTTRFRPEDSTVTMIAGMVACIFFFTFFSIMFSALLKIFDRLPYAVTRLMLWMGVMVVFDPVITLVYDVIQEDYGSGEVFLLYNQLTREEGSGLPGLLLTLLIFCCLSFIQFVLVYWYIGTNHLNGRVNDIYERLLFPDTSFFCPHDLEVSQTELSEVVKMAKVWRTEEGDTKRVSVLAMNYHHTCFFRARLFRLLSIFTNDPEQWVADYVSTIPIRRPYHAKDLIEHNMGSFSLGKDVLDFLKRHFPHLTVITKTRVGDTQDDYYYESDLIREMTSHSASMEDDKEMREMLKAYFTSQVHDEKPVEWCFDDSEAFILKDKQLLADLIFFETSGSTMRALLLAVYLQKHSADGYFSVEAGVPDSWVKVKMPNFHREQPRISIQGDVAEGSIIHILVENPVKETRQLARAFVVTPFGTVVEPREDSYTCLKQHTADHVEFWAKKAVELGSSTPGALL